MVERGLFESRAKARAAIEAGRVIVDDLTARKPSELVDDEATLSAEPAHPWVGRGGLKLDHALGLWPIEMQGRTVLDVGASTGGFTEVCLARGATRVFAVDVGRGQLHDRLRQDPRVVNLEAVDARALDEATIPQRPDLVVCDASFIGLAKVLPRALDLASADADLVCLVKPQFEAGPDRVDKGLVKDPQVRLEVLQTVSEWLLRQGWRVQATSESPVAGGQGNVEYLLWARRS